MLKVEEKPTPREVEAILFNSDTLTKVITYLPSVDLLNLALTCQRFGSHPDDELSLVEESATILVHEIATEEQLAVLPHYDGESSLADYHYLQLLRAPLVFDQLVDAKYVNEEDKTCVRHSGPSHALLLETALSNNIMRVGKHYVSFTPYNLTREAGSGRIITTSDGNVCLMVGVIRPGQVHQNASGTPLQKQFFQHFSRTQVERYNNNDNSIDCCLYTPYNGCCSFSDWSGRDLLDCHWEGRETMASGMILECYLLCILIF